MCIGIVLERFYIVYELVNSPLCSFGSLSMHVGGDISFFRYVGMVLKRVSCVVVFGYGMSLD